MQNSVRVLADSQSEIVAGKPSCPLSEVFPGYRDLVCRQETYQGLPSSAIMLARVIHRLRLALNFCLSCCLGCSSPLGYYPKNSDLLKGSEPDVIFG